MSAEHKNSSTTRWAVVLAALAALVLIMVLASVTLLGSRPEVVVVDSDVEPDGGEYAEPPGEPLPPEPPIEVPAPTEPAIPSPPPVPTVPTPVPPPSPERPEAPPGIPQSFTYDGMLWDLSAGPMPVDVLTTGRYTDGYVIYHRVNDKPPYEALYVETAPNSGLFYKYLPAADE